MLLSWFAIGSALWLGILTSISPCPLASNIAAISFIGRRVDSKRHVLLSGLFYTFGRTLTYLVLGMIVMAGLLASGEIARFLQKYMNQILGPVLILVGMILLGLLNISASFNLAGSGVQERAGKGGIGWSVILGILFALSFCPVSAGLFFGGLIPLSTSNGSKFVLPGLFGIGTALPVIVFAFLMAFGSQYVGRAFNRMTQIEWWVRMITGTIFILAGIYYCLTHIYGVSFSGMFR
jgi:cytochrome c biogenesis protein CcdA